MNFRKNPTTHEHKNPVKRSWDALSSRQKVATLGAVSLAFAFSTADAYTQDTNITYHDLAVEILDEVSGASIPETTPPPPLPGKVQIANLTIGTYNAWYKKEDADKSIKDVLNLMRGTPNTPGVDILGLQEFKGDNEPESFKEKVPLCDTCEFNAFIPDSEASAMSIVYKPAKVTPLGSESIPLHPKQEADGEMIASKHLNIVLYKLNETGQQFYHINFHMVYGIQNGNELNLDNPERLELLDVELGGIVPKTEEIKLSGLPVFATYDANMTANSTNIASPKNILIDLGFIDAHDPAVPDNTPQEQGTHKDRDIDYVSVHPGLYDTQVQILGSWTIGDSLLELASDHDAFVINAAFLKDAA